MATSGSTNYSLTASQVINEALHELRVIELGASPESALEAACLKRLNMMIKRDQAEGVKLWRRKFAKLFVVDGTASYNLPGANACDLSELSETTLDADEASGQTVLSVASTSGFANSDNIGIVLDDDTIHWTTISSFVTDDTVTVASGLASAASSGNKVYVYTTAIERPLKIESMQREKDGQEIPMFPLSREEYERLPNKSNTGEPVNFYYDPQLTTGKLYLWQVPDTVDYEINFTYLDALEDIDNTSDDFEYPQEWLEYLVSNLAVRCGPLVGKNPDPVTVMLAQESKAAMMAWDQEEESIQFAVSRGKHRL